MHQFNEAKAAADASAPVATNVINDAFPPDSDLSTRVVANIRINEARAAADAAAPLYPMFIMMSSLRATVYPCWLWKM